MFKLLILAHVILAVAYWLRGMLRDDTASPFLHRKGGSAQGANSASAETASEDERAGVFDDDNFLRRVSPLDDITLVERLERLDFATPDPCASNDLFDYYHYYDRSIFPDSSEHTPSEIRD